MIDYLNCKFAKPPAPKNYTDLINHLHKGETYYAEKKYKQAITELTIALTPNPALSTDEMLGEGYYIFIRGLSYAESGNYNRAIKDFTTIIKSKPDKYEAIFNRGLSYYHKGCYDLSIKDYTTALTLTPDNPKALFNRGVAHAEKGNYDLAIEDYTAALKLDPTHYGALINRGNAYYRKGIYAQAIEDFEAALRIDPNDDGVKRNIEIVRRRM